MGKKRNLKVLRALRKIIESYRYSDLEPMDWYDVIKYRTDKIMEALNTLHDLNALSDDDFDYHYSSISEVDDIITERNNRSKDEWPEEHPLTVFQGALAVDEILEHVAGRLSIVL